MGIKSEENHESEILILTKVKKKLCGKISSEYSCHAVL